MEPNNPFNNWLNENAQPDDQTTFPTQRFYDRVVPGTAARIEAFNNRPPEAIVDEIITTQNLLDTRVARFDALIDKNVSLREKRDNMRARYGGEYEQMTVDQLSQIWRLNEQMNENVQKARYIINSKKMLKLKIQMLNKEF